MIGVRPPWLMNGLGTLVGPLLGSFTQFPLGFWTGPTEASDGFALQCLQQGNYGALSWIPGGI